MRLLLLEQLANQPDPLAERLEAAGCQVLERLSSTDALESALLRQASDVLVLDLVTPDVELVQRVGQIGQRHNQPVAVFVEETDVTTIKVAVNAGISSYIVRGSQVERLRDALEVARARFASEQSLRSDLASARSTLVDRKVIERAKGRLMKEQGLDEDDAFRALREISMRRNCKMVEVARSILDQPSDP
ncbi:MAG: ANTAR domain-containing protein [Myxococcota bacterium]